jgi:hypothetical protein
LRHVWRQDLAALDRISDQRVNGNAALGKAPNDQAAGPTGCSDDQDRTFGHLPGLTKSAAALARYATFLAKLNQGPL